MSIASVDDRRYVTPGELAVDLGVSVSKVLSWIHRGELRAFNLAASAGGRPRWRIRLADLEKFLAGRAAPPPMPTPRRRRQAANDGMIAFF